MNGPKVMCALSSVYPQHQTFDGAVGTTVSCQKRANDGLYGSLNRHIFPRLFHQSRLAEPLRQILVCFRIKVNVPVCSPLHQTRPKLFTSLSGRFRFIKPVQVPEANRQNVIRVGIVRFEPNGLSQIFQCDFVFACIDVGASELGVIDVIVGIMRIELKRFLQNRNSLLVLADDVEPVDLAGADLARRRQWAVSSLASVTTPRTWKRAGIAARLP